MTLLQISEPGESPLPHARKRAIGIDLGTTNSLVATVRHGIAVVLPGLAGVMHLGGPLRDYYFVKDFPQRALKERMSVEQAGRTLRRGQILGYAASIAAGWSFNVASGAVIMAQKPACVASAENSCLHSSSHARHQSHPRDPRRL